MAAPNYGDDAPLNSLQEIVVKMVRTQLKKSPANISSTSDLIGYIEREKDVSCLMELVSSMSMADMRRCASVLQADITSSHGHGQIPTPPHSLRFPTSNTARDVEQDTRLNFEIRPPNSVAMPQKIVIGSFVPDEDNFITESTVRDYGFRLNERNEVLLDWEEKRADGEDRGRYGSALFRVVPCTPNGCNIALGTACQRGRSQSNRSSVARDSEANHEELDDMAETLAIAAILNADTASYLARKRNHTRRPGS